MSNRTAPTTTGPTDKQVSYALALMGKAGFNTRFMNRHHADLGATMRQRSGTVENWLRSMSRAEISDLISKLQKLS